MTDKTPAHQKAWGLTGVHKATAGAHQIAVSLRRTSLRQTSDTEAGTLTGTLWLFGLYVLPPTANGQNGRRFAVTWAVPRSDSAEKSSEDGFPAAIIAGLLADALPKTNFSPERETALSASLTPFQALEKLLTGLGSTYRLRPLDEAEMTNVLARTQSEPLWVSPSSPTPSSALESTSFEDTSFKTAENGRPSLGDVMTVGLLVEKFLHTLLKAQAEAPTPEACGQACAEACQHMARVFCSQDPAYAPLSKGAEHRLAEKMTDNDLFALPLPPNRSHSDEEIMTAFFMTAGLRALDLLQNNADGRLSEEELKEKLDRFRKNLTLFLSENAASNVP